MSSNGTLESWNKKELINLIGELRETIETLKTTEKKIDSLESSLPGLGISILQKDDRSFHLVQIGYNSETGAAKVINLKDLETKTLATAVYLTQKELVEKVASVQQINHLKKGE
jgi:hypothetical protein